MDANEVKWTWGCVLDKSTVLTRQSSEPNGPVVRETLSSIVPCPPPPPTQSSSVWRLFPLSSSSELRNLDPQPCRLEGLTSKPIMSADLMMDVWSQYWSLHHLLSCLISVNWQTLLVLPISSSSLANPRISSIWLNYILHFGAFSRVIQQKWKLPWAFMFILKLHFFFPSFIHHPSRKITTCSPS